ncbi:MAG: hypothetical protein CMH48_15545 [Muricauda sp.]|nr:hypothetical protein [Allomuricauda sp.]MAU26000.1 hypothetical protein [Allomuricauda sp.]MBC32240.1 hypothetical protein [Allomuricauda sp.]|tara:strand:- start:13651 stop:14856 length:1206 start_codon:yes stop_codon:yes gene_type:complete
MQRKIVGHGHDVKIALFYFCLAAIFGVVLRLFPVVETQANYKFIVHTHSHIALLGWVYIALASLLYRCFIRTGTTDPTYLRIFWFTQLTLVGMLFAFPFQGYALFSIIFSTLFLFASYWFLAFFLKNQSPALKKTPGLRCAKAALLYMVISSIGPWALGGIMNTLGAESVWYRMAIYFYLHFQYNGWMILALTALAFLMLERHKINLSKAQFKKFFLCLNMGIVLSLFLSTLWVEPPLFFYFLGGMGAILQLFAFAYLILLASPQISTKGLSTLQRKLLKWAVVFLITKILLQLLTSLPYFAKVAASYLDLTIGYLHLTFLGVVSIGLFLFLDYFGLLKLPRNAIGLYLTGFVGTETLIFYKGVAAWQSWPLFDGYYEALAIGSLLIVISLLAKLALNLKK